MSAYRDRPSMRDAPLSGLEIWLAGTPTELDAAIRALTAAGRIAWQGPRRPMTGPDAGRARMYVRLSVAPTRRTNRPARPDTNEGATVLTFPDRRQHAS
ncbi:hypothetical protein [Micromonospora sp. NPDC005413]|uniref:hypothetical protein n=1 Tax=Micromonospora sp. NPDC005413 TaxID=3154563 RepID=UPI0033B08737